MEYPNCEKHGTSAKDCDCDFDDLMFQYRVRLSDSDAELARLRAEVEKLKAELTRSYVLRNDVLCDELRAEVENSQRRLNEVRDDCERRLAIRNEEVENLRADVVWAVRHGACAGYDGSSWPCITYAPNGTETYEHHKMLDQIEYNGTDASLLSEVRRAREATNGEV